MFPLRPFCVRGSTVLVPADMEQRDIIMMRTPKATALRTRCAERTRAMQLVCMCASILAPYFSQNVCVWKDMRCKYEFET